MMTAVTRTQVRISRTRSACPARRATALPARARTCTMSTTSRAVGIMPRSRLTKSWRQSRMTSGSAARRATIRRRWNCASISRASSTRWPAAASMSTTLRTTTSALTSAHSATMSTTSRRKTAASTIRLTTGSMRSRSMSSISPVRLVPSSRTGSMQIPRPRCSRHSIQISRLGRRVSTLTPVSPALTAICRT